MARGICESFNGRFRDEFLVCEQFDTLLEVQVLAEDWRIEYNQYRPHGSLDSVTPEAFRTKWINNHQLQVGLQPGSSQRAYESLLRDDLA